ncbi:RTC4-like domain-containing protein [Mucidula mucida]|nr:RTC4-like domain-containing protein [Mucidula mucida]
MLLRAVVGVYYPNAQCIKCNNHLNPPNVNLGRGGNIDNLDRVQQTCTNRYCCSTIFHSPSLPFAIATAMVDKMKSNPGFLYTADMFENLPTISQSQRVILENGTELPIMVHQKTEIQANLRVKGGIYCRNPLCRTQSVPPAAGYAKPLSEMWQHATPEWLAAHQAAAIEDDAATARKKCAQMALIRKYRSVKIVVYYEKDREPMIFDYTAMNMPDMTAGESNILQEALTGSCTSFQTYVDKDDEWHIHGLDTVRQVATGDVLIYRVLPDGINGTKLTDDDCPDIETYYLKAKKPLLMARKRKAPAESISTPVPRTTTKNIPKSTTMSRVLSSPSPSVPSPSLIPYSNDLEKNGHFQHPWPKGQPAHIILDGIKTILERASLCGSPRESCDAIFQRVFPSVQYSKGVFDKHLCQYRNASQDMREIWANPKQNGGRVWDEFFTAVDEKVLNITDLEETEEVDKEVERPRKKQKKDNNMPSIVSAASSPTLLPVSIPSSLASQSVPPLLSATPVQPPPWLSNAAFIQPAIYTDPVLSMTTPEFESAQVEVANLVSGMEHVISLLLSSSETGICERCDGPLPINPSQQLSALSNRIATITSNEHNIGLLGDFCALHKFEAISLPNILATETYPHVVVNFAGLLKHITKNTIIQSFVCGALFLPTPHRDFNIWKSYFFSLTLQSVKVYGANKTFSLSGELLSINITSAEYYGPRGLAIITKSLLQTYPNQFCNAQQYWSMPSIKYLERVLVPEVTTALIMEDLAIDYETAAQIKIRSTQYGQIFFPDNSSSTGTAPTGITLTDTPTENPTAVPTTAPDTLHLSPSTTSLMNFYQNILANVPTSMDAAPHDPMLESPHEPLFPDPHGFYLMEGWFTPGDMYVEMDDLDGLFNPL